MLTAEEVSRLINRSNVTNIADTQFIAYGAGNCFKENKDWLRTLGVHFVCDRVINKDYFANEFYFISPIELRKKAKKYNNLIVIITVNNKDILKDVCRQLNEWNISQYIYFKELQDFFGSQNFLINDGYLQFAPNSSFKKKYGQLKQNTIYIVCPCSIGDTLTVCSLVYAYKIKNQSKKICFIVKKSHAQIPNLFDAVDEIIADNDLVRKLDGFSTYNLQFECENYLYGYFKRDSQLILLPEVQKYVDENDYISSYRSHVLGIREEFAPQTMLSEPLITTKKSILLIPYAQTAPQLSRTFWEKIADYYLNNGYAVYTNVKDESEEEIRDTKRFCDNLINTAKFSESCSVTICLRCGMSDLLALYKANLIVLNTDRKMSENWNVLYLNNRKNILNINIFEPEDEAKAFNQIITMKAINHMTLSTLGKTWLFDLDGTLVKHNGYKIDGHDTLLFGVKEYLEAIPSEDKIIILTSRTDEYKDMTLKFLEEQGIRYDEILFNIPYGERIVVNDRKPSGLDMAIAVNIDRDCPRFPEIERKL